jgi:hypothetical protein
MDEMIAFDLINFRRISLFSLYHRECDKKEDNGSGDSEIFCFETKKGEEVLSENKSREHRYEEHQSETHTILFVFFMGCMRMEFRIEREGRQWLKEGYEREEHGRNYSDMY